MSYETDLDMERARMARLAKGVISRPKAKMTLAFRCVDVPTSGREFDEFMEMLDKGRDISFETFARHVDWKPIAQDMGYATGAQKGGLRLDKDHHVRFKTSDLNGEKVYYMVHSAIEYVFRSQSAEKALKPRDPWH
jgi:hypothetical protein